MPLPDELMILGKKYKVAYYANQIDVDPEHKKELLGHISHNRAEIRIWVSTSRDVMLQTLLHEIIHALAVHFHLDKLDAEERDVDLLATGIYDTLTRNGVKLWK